MKTERRKITNERTLRSTADRGIGLDLNLAGMAQSISDKLTRSQIRRSR
jgi:hypothetical protein